MTSNKFAGYAPNTKPPPQCKTKDPPVVPWLPSDFPPQLYGWGQWMDAGAPPIYVWLRGYITLARLNGQNHYKGSCTTPGGEMRLELEQTADPDLWDCTLWIDPIAIPGVPESFTWYDIRVNIDPFDTWALTDIHIEGIDFREARIMQ